MLMTAHYDRVGSTFRFLPTDRVRFIPMVGDNSDCVAVGRVRSVSLLLLTEGTRAC
jgi:hypothetical protein